MSWLSKLCCGKSNAVAQSTTPLWAVKAQNRLGDFYGMVTGHARPQFVIGYKKGEETVHVIPQEEVHVIPQEEVRWRKTTPEVISIHSRTSNLSVCFSVPHRLNEPKFTQSFVIDPRID